MSLTYPNSIDSFLMSPSIINSQSSRSKTFKPLQPLHILNPPHIKLPLRVFTSKKLEPPLSSNIFTNPTQRTLQLIIGLLPQHSLRVSVHRTLIVLIGFNVT